MKHPFPFFILLLGCGNTNVPSAKIVAAEPATHMVIEKKFDEKSWPYFLQHLQIIDSPIVDFRGRQISYQEKSAGIIPYDVGKADLQQCADALMRLRAEYLFSQQRYDEIGFHFTSGQFYSWNDYCSGKRAVPSGNNVRFINTAGCAKNHKTLRSYLDIVYAYASTISLAKELKNAEDFEVGTIIIHPGSPGHCFIIIDEATIDGKKMFRLAEGYTPAQSIYVLRNTIAKDRSPWYELHTGVIETASYRFSDYALKKFE